jgi:hypothetical protein
MFEHGSSRHVRGMKAEDVFVKVMERDGYTVTKSTEYEDRRQHIDFHVTKGAITMRVDVKACKRVNGSWNSALTWVEIQNEHGCAWLYAENLTHIAFRQPNGFLIIALKDLQDIVHKNCSNATTVTTDLGLVVSNPSKYCYRRPPRGYGNFPPLIKEKTILVDTRLIRSLATFVE